MISKTERGFLKSLYLRRITFDEFYEVSSLDGNTNLLNVAVEQKDDELIEYLLVFYYHFGFSEKLCETLQYLMIADWHKQHSEIARILQFKLCCPDSIDYLAESINKRFSYLFEQDDYYPFVRKCLNAIRSVGGDNAKNVLEGIAAKANDQEIKDLAAHQLAKL